MEVPNLLLNGFHQCPFQLLQSLMRRTANQYQIPSQKKDKWKESSIADKPFQHSRFRNMYFVPNQLLLLLALLFQILRKKTGKVANQNEKLKISSLCNNPFLHFRFQSKSHISNPPVLLLLLVVFAFQLKPALSLPLNQSHETAIAQSDYRVLLAFKHALVDPRGVLKSWNDSGVVHACSGGWGGIKCAKRRVVSIQLPSKGLSGQISDKIGRLNALQKLSLHDNFIKGQIPLSLGLLPNLRAVSLFNNRLSGSIPPSIGNCPLLRSLDLSRNSLYGVIPDGFANSTKLYRFNLSYNSLTGPIPTSLSHSSSLVFLHLQHNNLSGSIPPSLGRLGVLEEIALNNNNISGSIPEEIGMLNRLRILDLSNNNISGAFSIGLCNLSSLVQLNLENNHLKSQIPEAVEGMRNLSVLVLSRNQLEGQIPSTLGNISGLSRLDISENNLTGRIPNSLSGLHRLESFNASYNHLSGSVPLLLSKNFNSSSFKGNVQLCGYSVLVPCPPSPPPPSSQNTQIQKTRRHRKMRTRDIILIAAALFLLLCSVLLCLLRKRTSSSRKDSRKSIASMGRGGKGGPVIGTEVESGGETGGKLVHFDGPLVFTADDLLCATAEIMGKSNYGTIYKATLEDGNQVAVKRLKEKIAKNGREFEEEAYALGKIRHPNLLALRAYYLGPKGEKLLVFDYLPRGSLASFLHARGPDMAINWATRMKITKDITRGLSFLHTNANIVHGNLTSGNVLLDEQTNAKITDFGLARLTTSSSDGDVVATAGTLGYRAPELSKLKIANTRTDIYSLGVIMLELLTGKSPCEATNGFDLPQWVASIVNEEWTNEVFDLDLTRNESPGTEDELLNTLKLALHCVDPSPAARPEIQQVLGQLEEIKTE
eukprot:TRINITY_DN17632_c0_g1_i2.p1 TRINITY_DN17632_c0_g1~~TRINITY_DN17632_c0_g1_i2.p1  ORF type:complete len:923 (+),score=157.10 TRINITY_DN17632_c0_g1_i2:134-2770(+)